MNKVITRATAAVLAKLNQPLEIRKIEIPPLLPGQVLVKVLYSGVCRSQLMEIKGGRGEDPWLPHLLGHEGSGIVVSIGAGVTKVAPGDGVILGWVKGAGLEAAGAIYRSQNEFINSGRVTTFSNYTIASENRLVIKPAELAFDTAVLFGCALPTGAGMVINELKPLPAESIALIGLGGIGLSALIALNALGLEKIIAIDISDEKLSFAKSLGATHLINPNNVDVNKKILELTGCGVDICIESGGQIKTIELGFSIIKNTGKLLFASHPPNGEVIKISPHELIGGKKISGSWGGGSTPDIDIPAMFELFNNTKIPLNALLTKTYPLESINAALNDLENGKVFRPLIVMQH
jgi:S-(hydroxymethyl)glutathione dehydrogenase/alcohol dehydrogenase